MAIASATQTILKLVEEETGRPVEVLADPSMLVLAKVTMAKGKAPAHLITYNPAKFRPVGAKGSCRAVIPGWRPDSSGLTPG